LRSTSWPWPRRRAASIAEDLSKAGAVSSILKFPFERTNHRTEVLGGVLAAECAKLLRDFFRARRKK
jgi:tRNA(adenine34) deaminase